MIKEATKEDVPRLAEMCDSFFEFSGMSKKGLRYSRDDIATMVGNFILNPDAVVFAFEYEGVIGGIISGTVFQWPMCLEQKILVEQNFWVISEMQGLGAGKALIEEFIEWGKSKGASALLMSSMDNNRFDIVNNYYTNQGFQHFETYFVKAI